MTTGMLDLLHQASALVGSLLVAVNTNRSARMLVKGSDRPLIFELDRVYVLAGPASVDRPLFDTRTPVELI